MLNSPDFWFVYAGADEIGRQQIRRELYALERAAQGARQGFHGERFSEPRHALHQQVPVRQHGHQHAFQKMILAHDHAFDFIQHAFHDRSNLAGAVEFVIHECGS